ncbi:MAG: DUF4139 domain-containing protein [Candidatus Latescibacteria bacterium]|nr:DUF4139 domain-containing protein [Candidatus Latescibacterota bacterium]NIO27276.1 DUF4139 domain-containing protein [Candidatus Latescibacterota bacterium]NIO54800.1 DUF4139 domain-containing protein [Candidatus Latescibacterota bacterium]NIT00883.1 DUF4139 domain-containing protein [Candidatus Latescibacterota bacterium]NIT37806.1 DUF4139 domain-containing protein [Candidatus Latescibacterota bacterium]
MVGILLVCTLLVPWSSLPASSSSEKLKSTPARQKSIGITIYNDNLGLVKDVRNLSLSRGVVELTFEGVAARIDPTSVHIRSIDYPKKLSVLEQNFEYDLISPAKLMEKYLGETVELITEHEGEERRIQAKLIGIEKGYVYEIDGKIAINPPGRVVMPALPGGLISKPSLVWLLDSDRVNHLVEASYLTEGIGWKANYVAVLSDDDTKMDLAGWVTIDNRSGATYRNATLKLVAGDVHRVRPPRAPRRGEELYVRGAPMEEKAFVEEAFFEYHLYALQRPTTIKDNQTKQLSLLSAADITVKKSYVFEPLRSYLFSAMQSPELGKKVGVFINVENKKENGLGMPLPKGVVRVYKKDRAGDLQFVGEDWIDHTPEDEKVRVKMGEAFDVVADRTQTDFKVIKSGRIYESSYKISIRNHKEEDIVVSVIERLQSDWKILHKSHDYVKESSHRVRFDVPVPKKGAVDLTYTVQIRY